MNTEVKPSYPALDIGKQLAKAEGNLNFLASSSQAKPTNINITQGMAILDALHAVQQARKEFQAFIYEQRKAGISC